MKITIDFGHPYFEEEVLLGLTQDDLNCFYADASEVDRLNLFFVLEASLHRLQGKERMKTAAYCAFLMAYYLFIALTPPASFELAEFYIDRVLAAVTVGGSLMGILGMLVFIPLCSVLYALLRQLTIHRLKQRRVPAEKWREPPKK